MAQRREIVVGGLGGGGNVILALMVARSLGINTGSIVVASFQKCRIERNRLHGLRALRGNESKSPEVIKSV